MKLVRRRERAAERFAQIACAQRLVEDLDDSCAPRARVRLPFAMTRDEQDRNVCTQLVDHSRERRALQDRHALVGQHRIETRRRTAKRFDGSRRVRETDRFVTERRDDLLRKPDELRLIVDDQNRLTLADRLCCRRRARARAHRLHQRPVHAHRRARAGAACYFDGAAHAADDVTHDGQTDAGSASSAAREV